MGITQGDTEEEAAVMAADALAMVIRDYIEKVMPLPTLRSYRGKKYRLVQLPALVTAKAELYRAFTTSGIRKADLARRLGIPKTNVDRLFNIRHSSRIEHLDAAFRAVGKEMLIDIRTAA